MTTPIKALTATQLKDVNAVVSEDVLAVTLFNCTAASDKSAQLFEQASQLTVNHYHDSIVTRGMDFEAVHAAMSQIIVAQFNSTVDKEAHITKLGAKYKDEEGKRKTYVPAGIVSLMSTIKSAVEKEIALTELNSETLAYEPRTKSQLQKLIAAQKAEKTPIEKAMQLVARTDAQLVAVFEDLTKDEQLQVLASLSTNCLKLQPLTDSSGAPSKPMFI